MSLTKTMVHDVRFWGTPEPLRCVIWTDGDDHYFSHWHEPELPADTTSLAEQAQLIPRTHYRPRCPSNVTLASCILTDDTYVKRCAPLCILKTEELNQCFAADDVLSEVTICEELSKYPHPNIAEYRGVLQENGFITALCFKKYGKTLDKAYEAGEVDVEKVMTDIMNGLDHLHEHGFVHCDLNPSNILMDNGAAVIIDFDSCRRLGESMAGRKSSTFPWEVKGPPSASPQHDLLAAELIFDWLTTGEKPDPDIGL